MTDIILLALILVIPLFVVCGLIFFPAKAHADGMRILKKFR